MKVRFSRRAFRDLTEIADYIAVENPAAAARTGAAIQKAIDLLSRHPYVGVRNARAAEMRSWLVTPFPCRVHYRVRDDIVWIVHVRHTARRDWPGRERP